MIGLREPGDEVLPGYQLIAPVGSGGFGEVWECTAPGGLHKAVKFVFGNLNSTDGDAAKAEQELKALNRMKEVRHPFVISIERIDNVAGELLKMMSGADIVFVAYRGGPAAINDALGGQIQGAIGTVLLTLPQIKSGGLRALAVTSTTRSALLPEIPTVDQFVPGFEAGQFVGGENGQDFVDTRAAFENAGVGGRPLIAHGRDDRPLGAANDGRLEAQ